MLINILCNNNKYLFLIETLKLFVVIFILHEHANVLFLFVAIKMLYSNLCLKVITLITSNL